MWRPWVSRIRPTSEGWIDGLNHIAGYLLTRLREWGVDTVFGFPGDGINGLMAAFEAVGVRKVHRPRSSVYA